MDDLLVVLYRNLREHRKHPAEPITGEGLPIQHVQALCLSRCSVQHVAVPTVFCCVSSESRVVLVVYRKGFCMRRMIVEHGAFSKDIS